MFRRSEYEKRVFGVSQYFRRHNEIRERPRRNAMSYILLLLRVLVIALAERQRERFYAR